VVVPTDTPTDTPVVVPTNTPTDTPVVAPTDTPTDTPVVPTDTPTDTPVAGPTDTPTDTPVPGTPTDTFTAGPTDTPTDTPVPGTPTDTFTAGPTDTPTDALVAGTPTDTFTAGPTDTPTDTPVPGTPTDTFTAGPTDTPTDTPVAGTPTDTPLVPPTPTDTAPAGTPTDTPPPTNTLPPTNTPPPTVTFTPTIPQVKGSGLTKRSLVQAQCPGPISCNSLGITFAKGQVRIQLIRPPDPVGQRVVGKISVKRVFPPQGGLVARVVGDVSYGPDPDGDCPLANTQVAGAIYAESTMTCATKRGAANCKGILALPGLFLPSCTDVSVLVNNAHVQVYDLAAPGAVSSLIGRDGLKIRGRK
jgi:hypothetical protein